LTIKLIDSKTFQFIHRNWEAGDHEMAEEHIYKGTYQCRGNMLPLENTDGEITGTYHNRSLKEESFPLDKSSMVLDVTGGNRAESKIAGWYY